MKKTIKRVLPLLLTLILLAIALVGFRLTSITFKDTKKQWQSILKDVYWNYNTGFYTIHCTDGDISESDS